MFDKKLMGKRLRELRESDRQTLEDVANSINSSKGTLSNIELGKKPVSLDMAITLAEYFGVSLDYLLSTYDPTQHTLLRQYSLDNHTADCRFSSVEENSKFHERRDSNFIVRLIENLNEESVEELIDYLINLNARQN
jgi:transcriptional regulator with XRE-family HTH domain